MKSRTRRFLVVGGALAAVVALFFAFESGSGTDSDPMGGDMVTTISSGPSEDAETAKPIIRMKGGVPTGGPATLRVVAGERVGFTVVPDGSQEEVHVHGYDISRRAVGVKPIEFSFTADLEGSYEIEAHMTDGEHVLVGTLEVRPK